MILSHVFVVGERHAEGIERAYQALPLMLLEHHSDGTSTNRKKYEWKHLFKGRSKYSIYCLTKKLSKLMRGNTRTATKRKTFAVVETPSVDSPQRAVKWRLQRTEETYEAGNRSVRTEPSAMGAPTI